MSDTAVKDREAKLLAISCDRCDRLEMDCVDIGRASCEGCTRQRHRCLFAGHPEGPVYTRGGHKAGTSKKATVSSPVRDAGRITRALTKAGTNTVGKPAVANAKGAAKEPREHFGVLHIPELGASLAERPEDNRMIVLKDLELQLRVQRSVLDKAIESVMLERSNAASTSSGVKVPREIRLTGSQGDDPLELSSAEEEEPDEGEEVRIEKTPKGSSKGKEKEKDVGEALFLPDPDES